MPNSKSYLDASLRALAEFGRAVEAWFEDQVRRYSDIVQGEKTEVVEDDKIVTEAN